MWQGYVIKYDTKLSVDNIVFYLYFFIKRTINEKIWFTYTFKIFRWWLFCRRNCIKSKTVHDNIESIKVMKNVDKRGLVYIPGVEISCEKMIISIY